MFERKCYKDEVIIRESDNKHYFYVCYETKTKFQNSPIKLY